MPQTTVLIDYDLVTGNIARIVVPEDDSQIRFHPVQPGWGRVQMPTVHLEYDVATRRPLYGSSLQRCADAVQQVTGRRPPNVPP